MHSDETPGLPAGTYLGPYRILASIGAGGMGQVYEAADERLDRRVAVKVLPPAFASDADRLARFEREARAVAGLSHPNILTLFDVGREGATVYAVMELLEGETLADLLRSGPLPPSKAIELALQVVRGLSAAHERGVIHRDLKPANIFLTRDGHVKLLDFGLARLAAPAQHTGSAAHDSPTREMPTRAGTILGTVGYMSPEQARGLEVDRRTDLFSFGAVFYEMVSGRKAFAGETSSDILVAILREDPPALSTTLPPALDRILRLCLEKRPEDRFSTAHDLALALQAISLSGETHPPSPALVSKPRRLRLPSRRTLVLGVGVLGLAAAAICAAYLLGQRKGHAPPPKFQRLTFRQGRVTAARFAPEGSSVVYSAQWEGTPGEVFGVRLDSPESRPLGFPGAELLGVSPTSELSLATGIRLGRSLFAPVGTLALAPFAGGTPRAVEEGVAFADWSPDGREQALVRQTERGFQLEYPAGKVLVETAGYLSNPRVSPSGGEVAFLEHPAASDSRGAVAVVDRSGKKRTLTELYSSAEGLAWSARGGEVWFTAAKGSGRFDLFAVSPRGRERVVLRQSVPMVLHDVARDGRVLVANEVSRVRLFYRGPQDTAERDLSWLDWSVCKGISRDGSRVLISENGAGTGGSYWLYVRGTDAAPPMRVATSGPGHGQFSADERSVVAVQANPSAILLVPLGPGQSTTIPLPGFGIEQGNLLPGERALWFVGNQATKPARVWITDLAGGAPRAVTPEGVTAEEVTPDGAWFLCRTSAGWKLYPTGGGEPKVAAGFEADDWFAGWGQDGRTAFTYRRFELPVRIWRVDMRDGTRQLLREIEASDRTSSRVGVRLFVTPDGRSYAYHVWQTLSELHCVEGLK